MSETNGFDNANNETPSETIKNTILNLIKGITLNDINSEEIESDGNEDTSSEGITQFLRTIEDESKNNSKVKGTSLSGYRAPSLVKDVLRICKDFPLWTCITQTQFNSIYATPTSASVESDFGELKRKILRYEVQPMTADRFVIKHLKAIQSNTTVFRSKQLRHDLKTDHNKKNSLDSLEFTLDKPVKNINRSLFANVDKCIDSESSEISEISEGRNEMEAFDNWRDLGENSEIEVYLNEKPKRKKLRMTTYMDPVPEIENILAHKATRSNLNSLLINGNIITPLKISKQRYLLHKTCPFDQLQSS